ncbi:hypothetical protein F4803DRAFT_556244 [Xylaria telfairii]|nr:hypothetical protein F4803DRAFT_556244 [Xylaria telfairii]
MATSSAAELIPFDITELKRLCFLLLPQTVNLENSLQGASYCNVKPIWGDIMSWVGGPDESIVHLVVQEGFAKPIIAGLSEKSKEMNCTTEGLCPMFIFLTAPDYITDNNGIWRSLLCTLICAISNFVRDVPAEKMSESGVYGSRFDGGYLKHYGDHQFKDINVVNLISLLSALQNCDFQTGYGNYINDIWVGVEYVHIVVVDRVGRLCSPRNEHTVKAFKEALKQTVATKMGGRVLFLDEDD